VTSPDLGLGGSLLNRVAAISASDVWAVGNYRSTAGASKRQTLIEHWDGTGWAIVSSPSGIDSDLTDLAVVSADDIWTVGETDPTAATVHGLIEHWNGSSWKVVPSQIPERYQSSLNGVTAISASDVWAVGTYDRQTLIVHWDGTSWKLAPSPTHDLSNPNLDTELTSVVALSATDVWAVGVYLQSQTLIEHWNGSAWNIVPSPNQGISSQLTSVAAVSASNIWAVGAFHPASGTRQTLIEHWNGTSWKVVPSPNQEEDANVLNGIAVISANDIWAVGYFRTKVGGIPRTLVERWDGTGWEVVSSPNQGSDTNELNGVAVVSAKDIWAVGEYSPTISGPVQTLVTQYP
jgi:hypothetical protein